MFLFHNLSSLSIIESVSLTLLLLIYCIYRMSEKFWPTFRKKWRELGTMIDVMWEAMICEPGFFVLATLLPIWQHFCWCLFWTFRATFYHPTKFYLLYWIHTWVRIFLESCETRLISLHIRFRGRVISE
jgi:hypothetical protein